MRAVLLVLAAGGGAAAPVSTIPAVDQLLQRVRRGAAPNRLIVGRATGATLRKAEESNRAFIFYEAQGVRSGDHRLGIDLRVPRPGGTATAGPLLVIDVAGPCLKRAGLEARYGPLSLSQVPRGNSLDEEAHWSRTEKWGTLSFGFAERRPECLASVVFSFAAD